MINLKTPMTLLMPLLGAFIGSTKGYDQFYSHRIDVIEMNPLYKKDARPKCIVDKSQITKRKIVYEGKDQVLLYGSWDEWAHSEPMKKNGNIQEFEL